MPSTSRSYTAYAAHALLFVAMSSTAYGDVLSQMTYKGCYSSSSGLSKDDEWLYQTSGYCQPKCVNKNDAVLATSNGNECWCGNELPPSGSKVDDDKCDVPCTGYGSENCGGDGYYSVYLSGIEDNVGSESSPDSTPSSTTTATVTSASPSIVTQISPGKTVVVTAHAESSNSADSKSGGGGGGVNSTAVAAGIVVAVVVISAIIAGLFFWLRHRRRQIAEEDYKRTQVSEFINGKPPQTGYSSMSDSRLDPEFGNKRNSHGSIADNEDFSRKILRVANPDRSG